MTAIAGAIMSGFVRAVDDVPIEFGADLDIPDARGWVAVLRDYGISFEDEE
ncbi:hypothetical protein FA95DRAFT_1613773 [Auriscalpium vulgare]|uniref:Uncharacterized protein n=1 Tax=Auriscalpium vulgare TaxID=40419 RepID=A0ACB8R217_9AGAM|nr:hypothetical protein FA95DRAFT_1613773 [Auriscalpium vulgare]